MIRINIILVDDHELFLQGLKASLEKHNFINILNTFNNVKQAISFLKKNTIDLVITDISMPEVNGIEFIRRVKKIQPTMKFLAISMFPPLHNEKNFYEGYLLKDANSDTVVKAIKTIVYEDGTFFYDESLHSHTLNFTKTIVTKREKEIIELIGKEFTVDEIAEELFISKHTVETHKKNIFLKLQVKTNAGLVKKAIQLGYIV